MTSDPAVLDEAFDRLARTDFELPNGFVNHGPMAVEALDAMGLDDQVDGWARWFDRMLGDGPEPAAPVTLATGGWRDGLGDYRLLPEWIGLFDRDLAEQGWAAVVELWVPRLMPTLSTALFHGVIRTAHAVRAVATVDTPSRRAELARALGYWAARYRPGAPPAVPEPGG
ncbi:MAG: questin oxidase family protein, partial [Acidimicrobiales bacterium]